MIANFSKYITKNFFHNPIFIVGLGRSGTTALNNALENHPLIWSRHNESPLVNIIGKVVHRIEFEGSKDFIQSSLNISKEYLYDSLRKLCFESVLGKNYGFTTLWGNFLRRDISILKKRYWCTKTFPLHDASNGLIFLYPKARFVYIVRNGLEVVQSMTKHHSFRDWGFSKHCEVWANLIEKYYYLLSFDQAIHVRHEKLVSDTDIIFRQISDFLNIRYHDGPAKYLKSNIIHPLDEQTRENTDVAKIFKERKPPYESWSSEQKEIFRRICGDAMQKMNYEIPF
ncbi:MAG: sulfotransferase [Desulfobacteraceae bacterium]|nr:sulfotransferase [Desulfobacteraceae bacterium]